MIFMVKDNSGKQHIKYVFGGMKEKKRRAGLNNYCVLFHKLMIIK
jgi:hypothetical protein